LFSLVVLYLGMLVPDKRFTEKTGFYNSQVKEGRLSLKCIKWDVEPYYNRLNIHVQ